MLPGLTAEALLRLGNTFTGLRLANRSSAFLNPNIACSGRTVALGLSHLGHPTAPTNMALLFLASAIVSLRKGFPYVSIPAPPIA